MDEQRQDDQLEPAYNSSVPIQDVALKTYRKRRTIKRGGERGSGRLHWWHDMMMMMIYLIYNYKEILALDNLQGLICHKTQPTNFLRFACVLHRRKSGAIKTISS